MNLPRLRAHLLLLLWAVLVASSFPVADLFNPILSTNLLVSVRFILAGTILLGVMGRSVVPGPLSSLIYSVLGLLLGGFFSIMFTALHYTSPLTLAALFVTQPLFAYLISVAVKLEPMQLKRLATLSVAALAALVIVSRAELDRLLALDFGFGEWLFLFGCVLSAGYNNLSRYASDKGLIPANPLRTTCLSLLAGGILIGLPESVSGGLPAFVTEIGLNDLAALLYLTLFTTLVTFWILQHVTLRLSPSMVAAYGYLPPMIVLFSELALGLTPWRSGFLLAALLLCISIWRLTNNDGHTRPAR